MGIIMKNKKCIMVIMCVLFIIILPNCVKAASISISASKSSADANESVAVTVSSDCTGRVNISVANGSASVDKVWVEGNSQSFTVTPNGKGNVTINAIPSNPMSLNGKVDVGAVSCGISLNSVNNSSNSGDSVPTTGNNSGSQTPNNHTLPATKSTVATLSNLGIKPNDFSGFSASKTSYSVSVPNATSTVEVYASKGQNGQTISGTGNKTLNEGDNSFSINVTAEDGTTKKTYTLKIHRKTVEEEQAEGKKEENTEEQTEVNTEEQKLGLSELQIEGITLSPSFTTDIYEYSTTYIGQNTKLNITTKANNEEATVEIIGNDNLVDGDNLINIIVKDKTGENTVTYQLTVNKSSEDTKALARQKEEQLQQEKTKKYIIVGSIIAVILIIIIIVILIKRRNKKLEDEYGVSYLEPYDDEDEQENNIEQNNNELFEEYYETEEMPKKKKSKGKRFK